MATTKPVLVTSRTGSAASDRQSRPNSQSAEPGKKQGASTTGLEGGQVSLYTSSPWSKLARLADRAGRADKNSDDVSVRSEARASSASRAGSHGDAGSGAKVSSSTMSNVLASFNKMQMIRQRTMANKGNVTRNCPWRPFDSSEAEAEVTRILSTALKGVEYQPERASILARSISDSIKGKLKNMKFPRYKFIVMVTITSRSEQGMCVGSRCLWNTRYDSSVSSDFSNGSLHAVAMVFAILHE